MLNELLQLSSQKLQALRSKTQTSVAQLSGLAQAVREAEVHLPLPIPSNHNDVMLITEASRQITQQDYLFVHNVNQMSNQALHHLREQVGQHLDIMYQEIERHQTKANELRTRAKATRETELQQATTAVALPPFGNTLKRSLLFFALSPLIGICSCILVYLLTFLISGSSSPSFTLNAAMFVALYVPIGSALIISVGRIIRLFMARSKIQRTYKQTLAEIEKRYQEQIQMSMDLRQQAMAHEQGLAQARLILEPHLVVS
jgi:prefoldin subunit 5